MKNKPPQSQDRFGWPKPKRLEEFRKLLANGPKATHREVFQEQTKDLPICRIPIELPKYRLANGRTASLQAEYLAKNAKVRRDLFSGDPELWDAQEAQHKLLLELAKDAGLKQRFEDSSTEQIDALLLDEYGFVVNGNRRLAMWRELLHTDKGKYGSYQHIDVAILPHCEEKEIDRLEARLQIDKDIRADYSWDARANMLLAKQKRDGFSNKELEDLYKMKDGEVQQLFDMRAYAEEFLKSRGKADHWSMVSRHEEAFKKLVIHRPRIHSFGKQEIFKEASFALIDNPDEAGGRLYEQIPLIREHLEAVKTRLLDSFPVKVVKDEQNSISDLFGTKVGAGKEDPLDMPLATMVKANSDSARKIIVEVIESQKQLTKDAKSANYLLDCCAQAQASLAAGIKDGLRPESNLTGVEKQLIAIRDHVEKISGFLAKHAQP